MRYSRQMRNHYLSNEFRENLVQYEIREKFWPNTRICFSDEPHEMVHETPYCFTVSDENLSAKIKGKLDHGVNHSKSGFKSLTFEDKAQDAELSYHISHAVSQVEYEVKRMRKILLYVPELYIGLLQNGRNWVAILRKVVCGEVLLTFVEAPPAFEVDGTRVREVKNDVNCGYIARLIEHAYCAANQITLKIMNPSMRPKRLSHSFEKMTFIKRTNTIKNVIQSKEYTYIHTYIHTLQSYIIYGISIVDIITADEMPCPRGWSAVPPRESINGEQLNIFISSVLVSSRAYSGSDA